MTDEELGKVREEAKRLSVHWGNAGCQSVCLAMIGLASKMGADNMTFNSPGTTQAGKPIGDWKITIKQTRKPAG
jgi:hypothetical protein